MFSTIDNIRNPLRIVDELHLHPAVDVFQCPRIEHMTQERFDLITHDPHTIYHITDSEIPRAYLGDVLLKDHPNKTNVLMGPENNDGTYSLYRVITLYDREIIIELSRFTDANDAVKCLNEWNRVGDPYRIRGAIRETLLNYISGLNNVNDFIIGILSMIEYKDDPRLQDVIAVMNSWGASGWKKQIPSFPVQQLMIASHSSDNMLFSLYRKIYEKVVVVNGFFNDEKYYVDPDKAPLTEAIDTICHIFKI